MATARRERPGRCWRRRAEAKLAPLGMPLRAVLWARGLALVRGPSGVEDHWSMWGGLARKLSLRAWVGLNQNRQQQQAQANDRYETQGVGAHRDPPLRRVAALNVSVAMERRAWKCRYGIGSMRVGRGPPRRLPAPAG